MIDELVLIDTLKKELEKARQDYHDNDEDVFSGAICSALETVIKAVREIPKLGVNEIKQINKKTDGYLPPMKERILHAFRDIDDKYIDGYRYLSTGLDALKMEERNKAIDEFAERMKEKILEEIYSVSESQKMYEVGSDMSTTYSHIMGTLRDVHHRIIGEIAEQMKEV